MQQLSKFIPLDYENFYQSIKLIMTINTAQKVGASVLHYLEVEWL